MEIDFRLGCTFTRYQTLVFREKFPIKETVLSYGPCQLPTLGFVVQRYLEIKYFKPEDYYFLKATCIID
jgi:DNA topoisomerase-3